MDSLDRLVEARVRDWERRVREGTAPPPPEATALAPGLELQLWKEIAALRATVAEAGPDDPDREALLGRARDLELQLRILLERTGRPRAAERLLAALRTG